MKISPRIEINLPKIEHNAKTINERLRKKGIEIAGVVKGVNANIEIAKTFINSGITMLADSKIDHLAKLKNAGIQAKYMLLRTPALSEVKKVVNDADISLNTEIRTIRALSEEALRQGKVHKIIIMVEMGDLREGILAKDLPPFIEQVLPLRGVEIVGIGTNFACFAGLIPTDKEMRQYSELVQFVQNRYSLHLNYRSGGNSANYDWVMNTRHIGLINHLRIGEAILLGRETAYGKKIPDLYDDAFQLVAEIIESHTKPSVPIGTTNMNAFGEVVTFKNRGNIRRAIINIGRHDVLPSGLTPLQRHEILGASSDHIILDTKGTYVQPGEEIYFSLNYGALLQAMTSPNVHKTYVKQNSNNQIA